MISTMLHRQKQEDIFFLMDGRNKANRADLEKLIPQTQYPNQKLFMIKYREQDVMIHRTRGVGCANDVEFLYVAPPPGLVPAEQEAAQALQWEHHLRGICGGALAEVEHIATDHP